MKKNNVVAIDSKTKTTTKPARLTPDERFKKQVAAPNAKGCELFTGASTPNGYGMFTVEGQNIYAHRFAWELHNNQVIPIGKYVLHSLTCTSRLCCAKDHLRIGTAAENPADMVAAGRSILGRKLNKRAMTAAEREQIISLSLSGMSGYAIAKKLDRTEVTISYHLNKNRAALAAKLKGKPKRLARLQQTSARPWTPFLRPRLTRGQPNECTSICQVLLPSPQQPQG